MPHPQCVRYGEIGFQEAYGVAWSSRDEALFSSFFSANCVYVEGATHMSFRGRAEVLRFFRFMQAFSPDSKIEFTSLLGEPRCFAAEWTWSGTASGKLLLDGVLYPATGRRFSVDGVGVCRADDSGLITYHKDYYDMRGLLKQLGLLTT